MKGASIALVLLAAFCWGLSGVIAGALMATGWDPFVLSFYRGAVLLLDERLHGLQVLGMLLILITVTALSMHSSTDKRQRSKPPSKKTYLTRKNKPLS